MNALMAVRQAWARGSVPAGRCLARRWGSRLLAWAFGVALAGLLALLWWGSAWLEVWSGHEALAPQPSTPTALISSVAVPSASVGQTAAPLPLGPEVRERDAAWFWLQQRLQAHGLRLLALRPEPWQSGAVLAQQAAHLRLQGNWVDWQAFGRALAAHAPWLAWEQWQVQAADGPGQVQIDVRLRLWLRPEGGPAMAAHGWPSWPVSTATTTTAPLFAQADAVASAQPTPAPTEASAPSACRLWGVWTQAGQSRVVLGRGADWTVLAPGQSLGPQGLRLERIGAQGVHLSAPGSTQGRWLLWEETP